MMSSLGRRRRKLSFYLVLLFSASETSTSFQTTTPAADATSRRSFQTTKHRFDRYVSVASSSTATTVTSNNLEDMTMKELKDLLMDSGLNERGLFKKLTRKQDLVEFLQENLPTTAREEKDRWEGSVVHDIEEASPNVQQVLHQSVDTSDDKNFPTTTTTSTTADAVSRDLQSLPLPLQENLIRRGVTQFLPIQQKSFEHVRQGHDAVIHSPTGSGKTLAFVLPLVSRMFDKNNVLTPHAKGKHSSSRQQPVSPRVICILPSRELAKQVGKEWAKYVPSGTPVATVFGGAPVERHAALVRQGGGAHVVVGTPGRLRELVREGHLDYREVRTLVLDEADTMLDAADSPDVQAILETINDTVGLRDDYEDQVYQLVLVSATVNGFVREFASDIMEIPLDSLSFISVEGSASRSLVGASTTTTTTTTTVDNRQATSTSTSAPEVHHWYTASKTSAQPSVAVDLFLTLAPQLGVVFVPTKREAETVASYLASKLSGTDVRALHGDMAQAVRSRTIQLIRDNAKDNLRPQILVATDVASRGLDLPNVGLVVQFGVPRLAGKEGTCNVELYTHRTGRAGRVQAGVDNFGKETKSSNVVLLYDPAVGEGKLLDELLVSVRYELESELRPRPIPSSREIVDSSFDRATQRCHASMESNQELVSYFREKLVVDDRMDTSDPDELLHYLSAALAALTSFVDDLSPHEQHCSLLTGEPSDRTLHVYRENGKPISPPEVTQFCKHHGSGKMSRCFISKDSSAVFDLPVKRAQRLVNNVATTDEDTLGWKVELATHLPDL